MKKTICTLLMIYASLANAQNLTWSTPVALTTTIGYTAPQIAVSTNTPLITVGDNMLGDYYATRYIGGTFTSPIKLNPTGFSPKINVSNGPKLVATNDTVYLTFLNDLETDVYLQHSFDGGLTFSDTIKVVDMQGNIPQYSTVAIMAGGNPLICYASLKPSFTDPQYVVTKSYDAGNTFLAPVSATTALGVDPCDCCSGSIALLDNKVAIIFRNSGNNLRDMRAAISTDTANTFNTLGVIDSNGWVVANCPVAGGQTLILGDTLISSFMNGINGTTTYISTLNVNTNQRGFERPIYSPAGVGAQDLSSLAGHGDTVGIVWTQQNGSSRDLLFSYSTHGASDLGLQIDTLTNMLPNSLFSYPDLAFANGKFYLVFNDILASNVYYTEAFVTGPSGINEHDNIRFNISLDYKSSTLNINSSTVVNTPTLITISDLKGSVVETIAINSLQSTQVVNLNHVLTNGLYVITLSSKDFNHSEKLMVSK